MCSSCKRESIGGARPAGGKNSVGGADKVQPRFRIVPTLTRIAVTVKTALGGGKTVCLGEGLILSRRFPVQALDAQLHARPCPFISLAADKLFELRQHPDIIAMSEYLRRL